MREQYTVRERNAFMGGFYCGVFVGSTVMAIGCVILTLLVQGRLWTAGY